MFRAQSAHHQEFNDANCTYAASGIVTLCKCNGGVEWSECERSGRGLTEVLDIWLAVQHSITFLLLPT